MSGVAGESFRAGQDSQSIIIIIKIIIYAIRTVSELIVKMLLFCGPG
jgi:hypothetical protein